MKQAFLKFHNFMNKVADFTVWGLVYGFAALIVYNEIMKRIA